MKPAAAQVLSGLPGASVSAVLPAAMVVGLLLSAPFAGTTTQPLASTPSATTAVASAVDHAMTSVVGAIQLATRR